MPGLAHTPQETLVADIAPPLDDVARRLRLAAIMLFITAGVACLFIILPTLLGDLLTAILWPLIALSSLLVIPTLIALLYALLQQFELSMTLGDALAARAALSTR
jgi:hypothetical protein